MLAGGHVLRVLLETFRRGQELAGAREEEASQRRQRHRLDAAVEQFAAEFLFQLRDLHADGRGGDVQSLRSTRQGPRVDDRTKAPYLVDLHEW